MQMLRITQCCDPQMWYANLVGELVPYCGRWREAYKSLEPAGYLNRVEFADAEIVTLNTDGTVTQDAKVRQGTNNEECNVACAKPTCEPEIMPDHDFDDDGCCNKCGFDGAEWHWWKHSTYEGKASGTNMPMCKSMA